jgi:acetyl-CoA carboxylase biotin carboxyl carrier protein
VSKANEIAALVDRSPAPTDRGEALRAPMPGWFHRTIAADHLVLPGDVLGELDVLGHVLHVVAPNVRGVVALEVAETRRAVSYGDVLVRVTAAAALATGGTTATATTTAAHATHGLVFRAPTSGRFYGRPTPDKPAFAAAGCELTAGATVCLLEVMKTFHRVAYGGGEVPARARVREVLVADGDDVNAGDPLLALEAL